MATRGSLSFPTCLPLFSPSSAPRALATAASARAARVGTLRHSAPSAASSCLQWGRRYRKLAALRFKLKHAGKRLRVNWYISFDSIKFQEQQTQTVKWIACENRNWLSHYRFQKIEAEEDTNIFYVENRSRKLHCLSPLATQYSSFYLFCMLCPFGHFSAFLEIWPIILGTRRIFLFFLIVNFLLVSEKPQVSSSRRVALEGKWKTTIHDDQKAGSKYSNAHFDTCCISTVTTKKL